MVSIYCDFWKIKTGGVVDPLTGTSNCWALITVATEDGMFSFFVDAQFLNDVIAKASNVKRGDSINLILNLFRKKDGNYGMSVVGLEVA